MSELIETVREYYDLDPRVEWERLERHRFEFDLTCRYLDRYIQPGDKVLDIGGGPGRYSLYLAGRGCDVVLVDLAGANVRFAEERARECELPLRAFTGDARAVDSILQGQFDHVLLMGPLYHLLEEADRVRALDASVSLLRPGGTLFVSFISSYAGMIYSMKYEPEAILEQSLQVAYELFAADRPFAGRSFTQAFFIRHKDVLPFMSQFPLEKLHYFGQEGILAPCEEIIRAQPQAVIDRWLALSEQVCERPDLLSFSEHLMYIGKKP